MSHIATDTHRVTLINVFTVAPADQSTLVDLLSRATDDVMKDLPGFISANLHRSDDGTRVVNYAQWRSRADFEAMMKNPAAQDHMRAITEFGRSDPHLYRVTEVVEIEEPALSRR